MEELNDMILEIKKINDKIETISNNLKIEQFQNSDKKGFINSLNYIKNKNALEIGGPSPPLTELDHLFYDYFKSIDNVIYQEHTIWSDTDDYKIYRNNFIDDMTDLSIISDKSYECVIASHSLEHICNPIKALCQIMRVLTDDGYVFLILPKKEFTFDHKRDITKISHLIQEYVNDIKEDNLNHLSEILQKHDLSMDLSAGKLNFENFTLRSLKNIENRCLHHHVFDLNLLFQLSLLFHCDWIDSYVINQNQYVLWKKKIFIIKIILIKVLKQK